MICGAKRSDGAPCEAEPGHYGGHEWPPLRGLTWELLQQDDELLMERMRVPGACGCPGWLYRTRSVQGGVALVWVPDEHTARTHAETQSP